MNILELFAGSRSMGKIGDMRGHNVCSVDIKPFDGITMVTDCEFITMEDLYVIPDFIHASPPCTTYSLAAISHHRNLDYSPKTDFAAKSDRMIKNILKLISDCQKENLDLIYTIENPRGVLRKMDFMKGLPRTTVTYCSYGDTRMKPTDIWSNNIYDMFNLDGWKPRPMCYNSNTKCQHEPAPRGSKTGTQGLKGNYERSIIPKVLCEEIIIATEIKLGIE